MTSPPVLILHASGTNRDAEAALAVERAGGDPRVVHVNELRSGAVDFADHAAILLPGGFSYADALGAGGRLALELRSWFADELASAVRAGRPILGICNGFQALVKSGLLGGATEADGERRVTLARNSSGRFECRWVTLEVESSSRAAWLDGITELIACPVAHGEGRLVASDDTVARLERDRLVAVRYVAPDGSAAGGHPDNPNGSVADIAGLCDSTGTVVGLMPHPEDHIVDWQSPHAEPARRGLALFEAFVAAAR